MSARRIAPQQRSAIVEQHSRLTDLERMLPEARTRADEYCELQRRLADQAGPERT